MSNPAVSTDLKSKAILVDFDGCYYNWTRRDSRVEKVVAESNSVSTAAGRYLKNLFLSADAPLAAIRTCVQAARHSHDFMTIPWEPQKRLLLNKNFLAYTTAQARHASELETLKATLRDSYTDLIAKAQAALGPLFRSSDYPSITDILSACSISHRFSALSDSSDVRLEVGVDTLSEIRSQVEASQQEQFSNAVSSVWNRFHTILSNAVTNLSKTSSAGSRFRPEWHTHLAEFLPLLDGLNLTNDPNLTALAREAKALLDLPAEDYSVSPEVRSLGYTRAQKIYDDLRAIYTPQEKSK